MALSDEAPERDALPRYLVVADRLRERLERGEWQAGDRLPSLHELADEFGVARLTARQAVQRLVREGLLDARRGQGTVVRERAAPIRTSKLETSLLELGDTYRSLVPRMLEIDETPRPLPGSAAGDTAFVRMRRLHLRDDKPYCVITLYLAHEIFALDPEAFRTQAVIPVMLAHARERIAHAAQTLTIGTAHAETASLLRIPAGAPVANVKRTFRDAGETVVYYAEVTYRGDGIRLEIDLKP